MAENTLFEMFADAPAEAPCMRIDGRTVTYGEIRDQILCVAQGLRQKGIRRGDTVGVWLPNSPAWIVAAWACARLGVNVLSLNMRYGTRELGDFISRSKCRAVFYMPQYRGHRYDDVLCGVEGQSLASLEFAIAVGGEALTCPPGVQPVAYDTLLDAAPDTENAGQASDPCIVFASSGTTSQPKLIVHAQQSVRRHGADIARHFRVGADDRVLLAVPFSGAFGYTIAIAALSAHCLLVVMDQFDPAEAARLLAEEKITHTFGTDDILDKILNAAGPAVQFPALQVYGHANFTPALTATLPQRAAAQGVPMRGCYGLSEAMALFAAQPEDGGLERRAQSGGLPVAAGGKIRVRSLETGALLGPGEHGEIEIHSPNLTIGYLNNPEATAKAFCEDGYLKTGDLGYMMPDGGVTLLSRIGDVLRIGGYLVNPLEIEESVLDISPSPACQVTAIAYNNSVRPVAFVLTVPGHEHDEQAILAGCRKKLASFKVPLRVIALDEFPVTDSPNGKKVKKNVLKDMAEQMVAQAAPLSSANKEAVK
jgi:fatty-acyl-CoA synthase